MFKPTERQKAALRCIQWYAHAAETKDSQEAQFRHLAGDYYWQRYKELKESR